MEKVKEVVWMLTFLWREKEDTFGGKKRMVKEVGGG